MGLPYSKLDVWNMALSYCGEAAIANADIPTTKDEKLLDLHYDNVRQTVLRKYTVWNFAVKQATMTRIGTGVFDYADIYQLPADWVRFVRIHPLNGLMPRTPFVDKPFIISGRTILINNSGAPSLQMYYLQDVLDPGQWDAAFLKVVVLELAVTVCYQITKQMKLVQGLNQLLVAEIADAISIDGQEVPPSRHERSNVLEQRRMTYTGMFAGPYTFIDD